IVDGILRPHFRPNCNVAQAATCQGYKRNNGIKFQGVLLPNGINGDLWAPAARCRRDGYVMRSGLKDRLRGAQEGSPTQYYANGDTAHAMMSHLGSPRVNRRKTKTWMRVEYVWKTLCNLWGFLDHKNSLKLMQNPVGDLYLVGELLTNNHICLYDSQIIECYRELPPSVEAYFHLHGHNPG
ncbi:unnamed protein product, partial [Discosporangium mesarthrocarpum]